MSKEWGIEYTRLEKIRIDFIVSSSEETDKIQMAASIKASTLEESAHELLRRAALVRSEAGDEVFSIQNKVREMQEYKDQEAIVSAMWHKDDEVFQPKAQALMDKYLKAQEASN